MFHHNAPCWRQLRLAGSPVEQQDVLHVFQRANALADGRLDTIKLTPRGGKAAGISNRHENTQLVQRETSDQDPSPIIIGSIID
jgi:hypothetical protein